MPAQVHYQARTQRFPRDAASGAPRDQGDFVLRRVTNQALHIFRFEWDDYSEGPNLKYTCIRAVQSPTEVVKEELSFNDSPEVVE
jgi:hypothetical protein